jgi:post-segregation antitoxin (ccd killing protein)
MEPTVIYKTQSVHSSVRLPEELHAFARKRGINLSRTLAATLAAAKAEEEEGSDTRRPNQKNPIPMGPHNHRENHGDTSNTGGMG